MWVRQLIGRLAGLVIEVPHHVGEALLASGQAIKVDGPDRVETAVVEPKEHAVTRGAKKKK